MSPASSFPIFCACEKAGEIPRINKAENIFIKVFNTATPSLIASSGTGYNDTVSDFKPQLIDIDSIPESGVRGQILMPETDRYQSAMGVNQDHSLIALYQGDYTLTQEKVGTRYDG